MLKPQTLKNWKREEKCDLDADDKSRIDEALSFTTKATGDCIYTHTLDLRERRSRFLRGEGSRVNPFIKRHLCII